MTDCIDPIERYPDVEFPIEVSCNPTISVFPSGKTWAIAGSTWMRVPTGSTREDLPKWMKWSPPARSYEDVKIAGSKGSTYIVRRNTKTREVTCTCPGFKYRGKCKHLPLAFPS
jgi:hypothetical protein